MHVIDVTPLADWGHFRVTELVDWITENIGEGNFQFNSIQKFRVRQITLAFVNESDLMLFKLRWGL